MILNLDVLEDVKISWKAKGIYHCILNKPKNVKMTVTYLCNQSERDGRVSVRSGIDELIKAGYITKELEIKEK